MSREIKFRVWDGEQMSGFTIDIDSVGYINNPPIPTENKPFLNLMQYTGLKDKNGKEIYEGDVVAGNESVMSDTGKDYPNFIDKRIDSEFTYLDGTVGERRYGRITNVVEWKESSCGFEPFSDSYENCGHCGGGTNAISIEIIGNIYKNPDLISNLE